MAAKAIRPYVERYSTGHTDGWLERVAEAALGPLLDENAALRDVADAAEAMRGRMLAEHRVVTHSPQCAACDLCDALDRLTERTL